VDNCGDKLDFLVVCESLSFKNFL